MEKAKKGAPLFFQKIQEFYENSPFLKRILPYALIFLVSILSSYILFFRGYPNGDDYSYHLANIVDKYISLTSDEPLSSISGNLALGYGYGQGLFYSPLPHFSVAILAVILSPFGITIFGALKITLFLTIFVSGIFMYRFGLSVAKGNTFAALICSTVYVVYPYRMVDALRRLALAEACAFLFIPLFFLGISNIINSKNDSLRVLPFFQTVLGGGLLYLTHNLTAILVYLVAVIYLVFHIKPLLTLIKSPRFVAYGVLSVVLMLGVSSLGMMSQLELLSTGIYNLSNAEIMWTDRQSLASQTAFPSSMAGFLNPESFAEFGISPTLVGLGIWVFLVNCAFVVFIDGFILYKKALSSYSPLFMLAFSLLFVTITDNRAEMYMGSIIFICLYLFCSRTYKKEKSYSTTPFSIAPTPWFAITVLFLCLLFMNLDIFWLYLAPEFLLTIQFPWRAWSIVQFCFPLLICMLIYKFGKRFIVSVLSALLVSLLLVCSQPVMEKRLCYDTSDRWFHELDFEAVLNYQSSIGHNKEYCPQILTDTSYVSEYKSSLHSQISKDFTSSSFEGKDDYYLTPVFLTGGGTLKVSHAYAPVYDMEIVANNDSLIQLPLIYYPGYVIYATDTKTGAVTEIEGENIDGLVSFSLAEGSYTVKSAYEGTSLRNLSLVLTPICLFVSCLALAIDCLYIKKKTKGSKFQ